MPPLTNNAGVALITSKLNNILIEKSCDLCLLKAFGLLFIFPAWKDVFK